MVLSLWPGEQDIQYREFPLSIYHTQAANTQGVGGTAKYMTASGRGIRSQAWDG